MSFLKYILIIAGLYIATIVAFDIIGVLANSFLDIFAGRGKSTLLYYTVWFVLSIFAGLLYTSWTSDYTAKNNLASNNVWLAPAIAVLLSAAAIFFFDKMGQMQSIAASKDYYVPGNAAMTHLFFITFCVASFFGVYTLKPATKK